MICWILGFTCIGLAAYIIYLDSRVTQLEGYIKRMKR